MAANTNADIILGIAGFYAFLSAILAAAGIGVTASTLSAPTSSPGVLTFVLDTIAVFAKMLFFQLDGINPFFNAIMLTPLAIVIFYVVASYIRGNN